MESVYVRHPTCLSFPASPPLPTLSLRNLGHVVARRCPKLRKESGICKRGRYRRTGVLSLSSLSPLPPALLSPLLLSSHARSRPPSLRNLGQIRRNFVPNYARREGERGGMDGDGGKDVLGPSQALPMRVSTMSTRFRAMITATTNRQMACLTGPSTYLPMICLLCVYRIKGITANGMPIDSTT
ncbi:hypothetical protein PG2022B_1668 [Bifidobacterium animalis subsp. animalis]|nr:hypothetical protein PG2022B_1668 [Bifidobacterium animalis subsp. animalis]